MDAEYNKIITSFVDKYGLNRGQIIAEIEKTFSSMLSRWYKMNVVVLFSGNQLLAIGYPEINGVICQRQVEITTMRGWNTIKRILDNNLSKARCMEESSSHKKREHEMRWGEILKRRAEELLVEIEIDSENTILAECPLKRIGIHERGTDAFDVGQKRAFHLRRIEPVLLNGTPRLHVVVDRESKRLVEALFMEQMNQQKGLQISCTRRFVGKKSFLQSNKFLPREAIFAVSNELREHIQVEVTKG